MTEGHEVTSKTGAVAASPPEAARVGAKILEQGGNAFDATVATSMACCMLQPQSTGVGGYVLCAVVKEGATGKVWSVDANSISPKAAHEHMYTILPERISGGINGNEYNCSVKDNANVHGSLAIGPPGMMASWFPVPFPVFSYRWRRLSPWRCWPLSFWRRGFWRLDFQRLGPQTGTAGRNH